MSYIESARFFSVMLTYYGLIRLNYNLKQWFQYVQKKKKENVNLN